MRQRVFNLYPRSLNSQEGDSPTGENNREVRFNRLFAKTLEERAQLWIAVGASHTGAFSLHPDVYEQRVVDFFSNSLR